MKVLVTGSAGFVGRWLTRDLEAAGHEVAADRLEGRRVDVTDAASVARLMAEARPDAVAHLAAVAFGPDATLNPDQARAVNGGGTRHLLTAVASLPLPPAILVSGSSEIYGHPEPGDLPLRETAPVRPVTPYATSKAEQETIALSTAERTGLRVIVTRSFNQVGPGQREVFAVPALAQRALAVRRGASDRIRAGNLDIWRDLTDVRDVARAYRLLLEAACNGTIPSVSVFNVCSGTSRSIRSVVEDLCRLIDVPCRLEVDRALVRPGEPTEIRGDPSLVFEAIGWRPTIPFERTLRDLVASLE